MQLSRAMRSRFTCLQRGYPSLVIQLHREGLRLLRKLKRFEPIKRRPIRYEQGTRIRGFGFPPSLYPTIMLRQRWPLEKQLELGFLSSFRVRSSRPVPFLSLRLRYRLDGNIRKESIVSRHNRRVQMNQEECILSASHWPPVVTLSLLMHHPTISMIRKPVPRAPHPLLHNHRPFEFESRQEYQTQRHSARRRRAARALIGDYRPLLPPHPVRLVRIKRCQTLRDRTL